MRVANIMLGKGKGGLEQCAIDYAEALADRCGALFTIVDPASPLIPELSKLPGKVVTFRQMGEWDIFAARRLRTILKNADVDAVICHGNRAFRLARCAVKKRPVILVTHNDRLKSAKRADAIFATGNALFATAAGKGFVPDDNLFLTPNMVRIPIQKPRRRAFGKPVTIGFLGRLSRCKGAHILLKAAKILADTPNMPDFVLQIGGDGEEMARLKKLARSLGIERKVFFMGWVEDKPAFFRKLDIFCLPSLSEAFGIALLEAMGAGVPVVASDCSGPGEIIEHGREGILAPSGSPELLAEALRALIDKPAADINAMADAAFVRAGEFNLPQVGHKIYSALEKTVARHRGRLRY